MTGLQIVALVVVAVAGGTVTLVADPLRQTFVLGVYGLSLMFVFFVFQAPDVALSEIVVGTVGLPLIILAALRKIAQQERRQVKDREDE